MARTDVHRPLRALLRDPTISGWFTEHHDHRTGSCDLGDFTPNNFRRIGDPTRCYRWFGPGAPNLCGCRMCTGQDWRRVDRRRKRHRARTELHVARKLRGQHHLDVDVDPRRR